MFATLFSKPTIEGVIERLFYIGATYVVSKGWLTAEDAKDYVVLGLGIVGVITAWWFNRPTALVKATERLDVVEGINLDPRDRKSFDINADTGPKVTIGTNPPDRKFD